MSLRLNWTNRKRISRADVRIGVIREKAGASFSARIELASYGLDPACKVVVEAYRQTTWRRFEFGTVADVHPAGSCSLEAFGDTEGVQFRVKVLSGGRDDGRIWAEADHVPVVAPEQQDAGRRSLLNTRGEDLGERVWRLDLSDGIAGPELLVNNRLGDWRQAVQTPQFRSYVYPEVLRQILVRAIAEYETGEVGWQSDWIVFACRTTGFSETPDEYATEDEREDWVQDAVSAFCRQQRFVERFGPTFTGEETA